MYFRVSSWGAQISLTAVSMSVTMYQYIKLLLSTLLFMAIYQDSKNHINVILYIDKYLLSTQCLLMNTK